MKDDLVLRWLAIKGADTNIHIFLPLMSPLSSRFSQVYLKKWLIRYKIEALHLKNKKIIKRIKSIYAGYQFE